MKRHQVRVKICGLTNAEDAGKAAAFGADFLGFIFAPSPRGISVEKAESFWQRLPCGVPRVAVFRDQHPEEVAAVVERLLPEYLQFHGRESPALCNSFALPVIRALPAYGVNDLHAFEDYRQSAAYFLVDLPKEEPAEEVLPFEIARAALGLSKPVILAGGLAPGNVRRFVRELQPFGVDVARGVEGPIGKKDFAKMQEFIENAHGA